MLTSVALGPGFRRVLFRSGNARVWSRADGPRSGCRRSCDVAARAQELSGYECRSAGAAAFGARQEINGSALPDSAPAAIASRLNIPEIFLSVQGESSSVGWPTVFVRGPGCPLRCLYCDPDRTRFVQGKSVSVRVDVGARRSFRITITLNKNKN